MAKKIFLSYSRKDKEFARKIANDLDKAGHDIWWDIRDIEGGDRWAKEIQDGIKESEILAIILSPNAIASEWVEKEFIFASKRGMKIVPLLYEHCELPIWLLNLQYIDIIRENYALNFHQILESFEKHGRRRGDIKPEITPVGKRIIRISPHWFLLAIIALLVILVGVLLRPLPFSLFAPTNTATLKPTETNTSTVTMTVTSTPIPPTETETPTPSPTDVDKETAVPSSTSTPSPPPSGTPTEEGLAPLITDTSGTEMLLVASGSFLMGSDSGNSDEKPAHIINLADYYIDKYEVTNADYKTCVNEFACKLPKTTVFYISSQYRNHPVVFVSWESAVEFCEWRDARLPTEAEWEKAARGTDGYNYPWGNIFDGNALNYCDMACENTWADKGSRDRYTMTAPIGTYPEGQSLYGIFDMSGNATEWVADWYDRNYYNESPLLNPLGSESGIYRVLRGGSWYDRKTDVRTFQRSFLRPEVAYNYTGFRCAASVNE